MIKIYLNPTCKWVVMKSEAILVTTIKGKVEDDTDEISWGGPGEGDGDTNSFNVWDEE